MSFNPNAPTIVGNEWLPWKFAPGGVTAPAAAYVNSSATETIDKVMIPYLSTGPNNSYGRLWCEIYNVADLGVNETPSATVFVPNQDVSIVNAWYTPNGGSDTGPINGTASNLSQYVDDLAGVETWWSRDTITLAENDGLNLFSSARFAFNTNGGTLPSGRVLSVELSVTYLEYGGNWAPFAVDLYNNTSVVARLMTVSPHSNTSVPGKLATAGIVMQLDPSTGEPWTRQAIIDMDSGTNLLLQLTGLGQASTSPASGPRFPNSAIASMRLTVSMISEKRVAIGGNTASTIPWNVEPYSSNTANFCILRTPTGTDNWAKASGTDYLVVMRALPDVGGVYPRQTFLFDTVESGVANPHDQGHVYNITLDNVGRITAAGPYGINGAALGVIIVNTSNALSVDSQVYWNVFTSAVNTGAAVTTQRISNHATTNYAQVRAIIGYGSEFSPNQPLLFKIKRVSDNVQMGGTGTLAFADLSQHTFKGTTPDPAFVGGTISWYDVTVTLASVAALVSGTQYYIEISSTTFATRTWYAVGIGYNHSYSATGDKSYGDNTDYGTFATGSGSGNSDAAVVAITSPPAGPASLTVTTVNLLLPDNGESPCDPGVHASSHLAWAATSETVLFSYYEVQRSEDGALSWQTIARIHTEATVAFDDVEAKRSVAVQYRVRTVRLSGQVSTWRTQTGTTTLARNSASVIFATNANKALTVGYVWLGGQHTYDFLGDDAVNVVQFHERDLQVMFRPTEDRGVGRTFTLLIFSRVDADDRSPTATAAAAFAPLRAVVEADAPYVTVFTPDGERILAGVRVPSGTRVEPAANYTVPTVSVLPVASVLAVTDVA